MNCSFCGCTEKECALMIVAPMQAWICDNCVQLCMDNIFKNLRERPIVVETLPQQQEAPNFQYQENPKGSGQLDIANLDSAQKRK